MKPILSERNIVVFLFVAVLITFVMAQEDSRKMQLVQVAATSAKPQQLLAKQESTPLNKPKTAVVSIKNK